MGAGPPIKTIGGDASGVGSYGMPDPLPSRTLLKPFDADTPKDSTREVNHH